MALRPFAFHLLGCSMRRGLLSGRNCVQPAVAKRIAPLTIHNAPGDKRALNKRVVEALANACYWVELDNAPLQRAWAYRRAASAIEDTEQDIGLIYRAMGRKGLESIENVGPRMAEVVEGLLHKWTSRPFL